MIKRWFCTNEGELEETNDPMLGQVVLYTDHIAEVCKLRDKLMECAKECEHCGGTGIINFGKPPILDDCPHCIDIRSVLA